MQFYGVDMEYSIIEDCSEKDVYEITIRAELTDEEKSNILTNRWAAHCFVEYWEEKLKKICEYLEKGYLTVFNFRIYEEDLPFFRDAQDESQNSVEDYIRSRPYSYIEHIKEVRIDNND